jgi:large repetitive protein
VADPASSAPARQAAAEPSPGTAPAPATTSAARASTIDASFEQQPTAAPMTSTVQSAAASAAEAVSDGAPAALPVAAGTLMTAVLVPLGLPGPGAPLQSPFSLALLAWTRRESQPGSANAAAAVSPRAEATAPVLTTEANDDQFLTAPDTPVHGNVLDNDTGPAGDALIVSSSGMPGHGTLTMRSDGTFDYVPDAGYLGSDGFGYTVQDTTDASTATASVTIVVGRTFTPPLVGRDYYDATQDTPLVITAHWGVLSNDIDVDGDTLTVTVATAPSHGTVVMASDGSFVYTPASGYLGTDGFEYTATDSTNSSTTTTVSITVKPALNLPPEAVYDGYQTDAGVALIVDPLANDTDPEGRPLTAVIITAPTSGTLTSNSDGTFTYTPATGFVGMDTFEYAASDGVNQAKATVNVFVVAPNRPPVAGDDAITVPWGQQVIVPVLANDSDPDGDGLYVSDYGTPTHGSTGGAPGGAIEYTPDADYVGTDSFTYTVSDDYGNTATATVTVTILPPNRPPIATDDRATTTSGTPVSIDVLANDVDPDGDPLVATVYGQPDYGTAVIDSGGRLIYTPPAGYVGTDYVNYRIVDPDGREAIASVTIVVTGTDDGGTPSENTSPWFTVSQGKTLTTTAPYGVVDQDFTSRGGRAGLVDGPSHGTLRLNGDGSFAYTPQRGFVATDTFTYYIGTSEWADGPFTATIEVTPGVDGEPGTETVGSINTGGGLPSCQSSWLPGQYQQDEVWPLCTYAEVRFPGRL